MTDPLLQLSASISDAFERASNEADVSSIETQAGLRFPPLFRRLLTDYDFESFVLGEVEFFGNAVSDESDDIRNLIFLDPVMSPALLGASLLQVGRPATGSYDPVCFNLAQGQIEPELVQVDHESILSFGRLRVSKVVAASFSNLIVRYASVPATF